MMRREPLLSERLSERPHFRELLDRTLRRMSKAERRRLVSTRSNPLPLPELWENLGCAQRYGFAVEPWDVEPQQAEAAHTQPLSDGCYPFVEVARHGRGALTLAVALSITERSGRVPSISREMVRHARLHDAPSRNGLFRAARYLAVRRARAVHPADLSAVLAVALTPNLRAALTRVGASEEAMGRVSAELRDEVGPSAVVHVRELVHFPPELLDLSSTWNLDGVATTCGSSLFRDDEVHLPDLDARWLVSTYVWNAAADGIPDPPRGEHTRHAPSLRDILNRHASDGWEAVFAGALRAAGWESAIVEATGSGARALVSRGLRSGTPDPERGSAAAASGADPTERAREEFAELRDALAARIIGRDIVDQLALVALAHRRGVSQRILLTGASGAGKSFTARTLAQVIGVPAYLQDANDITESGYRGQNVPALVDAMYRNAGSDQRALESSLLFLDEVDKTRVGPGVDGVSRDKRWGVQGNLLSLLDGKTPIVAEDSHLTVRTEKIFIICAGAFSDATWSNERAPTTADLVSYGIMRELAERLRDRIFLPPRTTSQLAQVLQGSDESAEAVLTPLARGLGLELRVLSSAYAVVARMVSEGRGGLGLRSGTQLLVSAAHRALLRALTESDDRVALVTPDDIDQMLRTLR